MRAQLGDSPAVDERDGVRPADDGQGVRHHDHGPARGQHVGDRPAAGP